MTLINPSDANALLNKNSRRSKMAIKYCSSTIKNINPAHIISLFIGRKSILFFLLIIATVDAKIAIATTMPLA